MPAGRSISPRISPVSTAENPNTIVVSAGDNIGATPLVSGMFHDEPTIEALSAAGLQISAAGNHEFDEGWAELRRMQRGGCHPVDGCQDKTPFAGARFEYLSANVVVGPGSQTLFPATTVRVVDGVKIGFIGLALHGTPAIVQSRFVQGLTFTPEVEAGNAAAAALVAQGVKTIVVLIHAGGRPTTEDVNSCDVSGSIVDIANGLSPEIDVIVSGHTHRGYVCPIGRKLVTSAKSNGNLITDIDLRIDRATGQVVSMHAVNVTVTRDIAKSARDDPAARSLPPVLHDPRPAADRIDHHADAQAAERRRRVHAWRSDHGRHAGADVRAGGGRRAGGAVEQRRHPRRSPG